MLALKIFLCVVFVCAVLALLISRSKTEEEMFTIIAICSLVLFVAICVKSNEPKVTAVAPEKGKIQTDQNEWGTITVTDQDGNTREYQGNIHISGTYQYETAEYMGLCVSIEEGIETGTWKQGMYKLYYEDRDKYWEQKEKEDNE